ncbi:MAG: Steroid 5-alpha reductase domain protein [Bacteroidetes bacterium]|nr:Steroid 5-alpha reductase domain protein [Bacteroidota bacterium]
MIYALFSLFYTPLIVVLLFQTVLFAIAIYKKNNGIADIGWGIGFIIISAVALGCHLEFKVFFEQLPDPVFILLITLVCIWGLRLSGYLLIRNWNKPEDWRYAKWREEWKGNFYIRSFFQVFVLQGIIMTVIGYPILLSAVYGAHMREVPQTFAAYGLIICGTLLWLIGFFFQAVGDYQLFVFKKDPANKGKAMRYGVWKYTRHPNYFGEACMWWGIFLLSCESAYIPWTILLGVISPITITFMLLRVSGVTMLENKYKGNKDYEDYQKNTSSFIPMRPHPTFPEGEG